MVERWLGKRLRDRVTGFEGVAIGATIWLNGCERVVVQPGVDKDGKIPESVSVDGEQLEILGEGPVAPNVRPNEPDPKAAAPRDPVKRGGWFGGGPYPEPKPR